MLHMPVVIGFQGTVLFILVVLLLVLPVAAAAKLHRGKLARWRTECLAQAAHEAGVGFHRQLPWLSDQLRGFALFNVGRDRRISNVLAEDQPAVSTYLFDYQWTVTEQKKSRTCRRAVVAFHVKGVALPAFDLRPDRVAHRYREGLGQDGVELPGQDEFNVRYVLRGPDELAIRRAFDARVAAFFIAREAWHAESTGAWLVIYRDTPRPEPEQTLAFLREAAEVFGHLYAAAGQSGSA